MWRVVVVFLGALGVYGISAELFGGTGPNEFAYFDRLAYSFLDGNLFIRSPLRHDLTYYDGRWYVPFPPLPALLMMPITAITNSATLDTIRFSLGLSALNVALTYAVFSAASKRGITQISERDNLWLTLLFALGTVHWMMSLQGTVWFLAQIATYTFIALALWLAISQKPAVLIGIAIGLAMLGRPHVAVIGLLPLALFWETKGKSLTDLMRHALLIGFPMLIAVGLLLGYNQARFDDWRDFGYTKQNVDKQLKPDLEEYGQFNVHFLPRNLRALLWAMPAPDDELGGWWPDRWGMSIFLTTPPLIFLLFQLPDLSKNRWFLLSAWTAIGLILVPLLLYYNTGWWQFGYRFALDFLLPLLLILAMTRQNRGLSVPFRALILVAILVNCWGTVWFAMITGRL